MLHLIPSVITGITFATESDDQFVFEGVLLWEIDFHFQRHWEMSFEGGMLFGIARNVKLVLLIGMETHVPYNLFLALGVRDKDSFLNIPKYLPPPSNCLHTTHF